jgi:transcriptional regulator with PAS, ATPase and Fis domain
MYLISATDRRNAVDVEDETVAARVASPLLISGASPRGIETIARRVHEAGRQARYPFVHQSACSFPIELNALREHCLQFLLAAAGGTMLISNVGELPEVVQEALLEFLVVLTARKGLSTAARLISGTTVSLFDRVLAGTFSHELFYRLNTIHLVLQTRVGCRARLSPVRCHSSTDNLVRLRTSRIVRYWTATPARTRYCGRVAG